MSFFNLYVGAFVVLWAIQSDEISLVTRLNWWCPHHTRDATVDCDHRSLTNKYSNSWRCRAGLQAPVRSWFPTAYANFWRSTQNTMDCSGRVPTSVLFPEQFGSKQGWPLCKPFSIIGFQNVSRAFLAATFVVFGDALTGGFFVLFFCSLEQHPSMFSPGFPNCLTQQPLRSLTIALSLRPS